ncbi:MAG: anti-sigma factor [Phycisphaerales bacterium]|nr:anti-sigma factor [Phycisphaerales bacterium]MCB9858565.1 anti-sigma factor [Phycisphaerales bacterium]
MKTRRLPDNPRILDLLADEATVGLNEIDVALLDDYFGDHPDEDRDGLCFAAAAIQLTTLPEIQTPSQQLLAALELQAAAHFASTAQSGGPHRGDRAMPAFRPAGLWKRFAIAALIVFAVGGWWLALARKSESSVPFAPDEQLAQLESEANDVLHCPWSSGQRGYECVAGEVIWSDSKQVGFLRLKGLPANNPNKAQYQLWIVDPSRDKNPIDGGVFDIPAASDEALVPIDAKLHVSHPSVFAITLEQPGGVVVSDGPLLVIAATKG